MENHIVIKGAKTHNLKNISLNIPRNSLVVITGLSGSGKSSLAFDTIYAEGQRRYVESLSAYARQFLEQMDKPDVEHIGGLSPTISIEQRNAGANPRSTVGTTTELYDYLRLLFARIGTPHCYKCGKPIKKRGAQEIVERVLRFKDGTRLEILAPLVRGRKGEYRSLLDETKRGGFVRVRIDGKYHRLDEKISIDKKKAHDIEALVDTLESSEKNRRRIADSIETALKLGKGLVLINAGGEAALYSELYACPDCGVSMPELEPRIFSFNSPYGACPACDGLGTKLEIDPDFVVPDKNKSISEGALEPWRRGGRGYLMYYRGLLREVAAHYNFSMDEPFKLLGQKVKDLILYGTDEWIGGRRFEGMVPHLERLFRETDSDYLKSEISKYMSVLPCPKCGGLRLKPESLSVKINNLSIADVTKLSIMQCKKFFSELKPTQKEEAIARGIFKEITGRLDFLINVGLGYLTLDRTSSTLSGGEAQRIRLATQLGAGLVGVTYILDEPSIGLHQKDNAKLLDTLKALKDMGNSLIIVEHDEATIRSADYIIDLGPGAGKRGGEVIASGSIADILSNQNSLTGKYLNGELKIHAPENRRPCQKNRFIEIKKAREHNLKSIDVKFPLGSFICVTGVSGSGKSTLIDEILHKALAKKLHGSKEKPGAHDKVSGAELIDKIVVIDQSPIGRTPRSNPATYTGLFNHIREIFAKLPDARARGYKIGRFSFNIKGGRCEACQGDGLKKIEMHFLPDVYVLCEVCKGKRYNEQTLDITYKGKNISDILSLSADEAIEIFRNIPNIKDKLATLIDVGLGYLELGQSATTLSGGEAQRMKLTKELSKRATGRTLYLLDEPTTGLHFADIDKLLKVLNRLVDAGNTVVVIEHNLDVIKASDYIIDLGPEGGDGGGYLVACGAPEEIINVPNSHTGKYLRKALKKQ